jgi:hypothetical protein
MLRGPQPSVSAEPCLGSDSAGSVVHVAIDLLVVLVIAGTSIWVLVDSINIGAKRDRNLGTAGTSPAAWFFGCLILWIVIFPVYLYQRDKIKAAAASRAMPEAPATGGPPAGWYPDPDDLGSQRWSRRRSPTWAPGNSRTCRWRLLVAQRHDVAGLRDQCR